MGLTEKNAQLLWLCDVEIALNQKKTKYVCSRKYFVHEPNLINSVLSLHDHCMKNLVHVLSKELCATYTKEYITYA